MSVQNTSKSDLQRHLVLEGTRSVTNFRVAWSNRWLAIGRGFDEDGDIAEFVNVPMPAVGTLIPRTVGGTVAVDADGIPLTTAWETLFYDPAPSGDVNQGSFIIGRYNDQYVMGDSVVWIAKRVGAQSIEWADRRRDNNEGIEPGDFWRNAVTGAANQNADLPDRTNDWSQDIQRRGKIGVGFVQSQTPTARFDLAAAGRSGTDRRNPGDPLYATGTVGSGPDARGGAGASDGLVNGTAAKFGFLHSNQSAGLVFGWNGIITQVGATTHDIGLNTRGTTGEMAFQFPLLPAAGFANTWIMRGTTPNNNVGWQRVFSVDGATQWANEQVLRTGTVGAGNGSEWRWHARNSGGSQALRLWNVPSPAGGIGRTSVNPGNGLDDALLTMFGDPRSAAGQFALGIRGSTLAYFTGAAGRFHRFYGEQASADNQSIMMLWQRNDGTSGIRFERGLPQGPPRPGSVGVNDLWLDTSGPGDPIVRCRIV